MNIFVTRRWVFDVEFFSLTQKKKKNNYSDKMHYHDACVCPSGDNTPMLMEGVTPITKVFLYALF